MAKAHAATEFSAGASAVLLALLGVDYYSMVWSFVGALGGLSQSRKMSKVRAIIFVLLSTLAGAALGTAFADFVDKPAKVYLIFGSLVAGSGAQLLISALLEGALNRIKALGGDSK